MQHHSYLEKRGQLEQYFDRTAFDAWAKLTSTAPVSGIRKTVRAGRDDCLLYTSPSPRDRQKSRMPSSA